jgi:IclR family pca regulon transcriptional regulator
MDQKVTQRDRAAFEPGLASDREFMVTLAKGLAVLRAFRADRRAMTLSQAAAVLRLSRATARRILRTLTELGYVQQNGREFALAPRVLELGFGFLATQTWIERAEPLMKDLSERLSESSSAAILQGTDIVHVLRVPANRIMAVGSQVGSRLPAFHTAMGRLQLGALGADEIWRRLRTVQIQAYTASTITDLDALVERTQLDLAQGFSIVDEELEKGLRSIAVPITTRTGRIVAALDVSAHATRTTRNELRERFLGPMHRVAEEISEFLS